MRKWLACAAFGRRGQAHLDGRRGPPPRLAPSLLAVGLLLAGGEARAQAPGPNGGAVTGQGVLNDHDGHRGTWSVQAVLKDGNFTGSGSVVLAGSTVAGPLDAKRSYVESGRCYFEVEQGRNHVNIGGPCTTASISGRMNGFFDGESRSGEMQGTLRFGGSATAPKGAPAAVVPTGKLTCAYQERLGGVVGGDLQHYELRVSNMVTLTLTPGGAYRTNASSGRYTRAGDSIRLVGGAFAGAVGRLRPDRTGQAAVYFERDENRRPNGVPIVDVATTACTKAR
jgi:hypothetical protein